MKYIVQGNYSKFRVTLTQKSGELITPYIPTATDEVNISLRGARVYEYMEYEQAENVLTFSDNGCLRVGVYELEVRIIDSEQHRLRCMYREQVCVVASNDDIPTDASFDTDDIELSGQFDIAASVEIDDALSTTSENPVQNKIITAALNAEAKAREVADINILKTLSEHIRSSIPMRNLGAFGSMEELDRAIIDSVEGGRITCVAAMYMDSYTSIFALNIPYYNGQAAVYVQWVFRAMENKRTFFSRIIYWDNAEGKYKTRGKKDIQNENI